MNVFRTLIDTSVSSGLRIVVYRQRFRDYKRIEYRSHRESVSSIDWIDTFSLL